MTTNFQKSLKISKKRVGVQDAKTAKKSESKSKCMRASARPDVPVELDKMEEETPSLPKNDKSPSAGDQTTMVGEGASARAVVDGGDANSPAQKRRG